MIIEKMVMKVKNDGLIKEKLMLEGDECNEVGENVKKYENDRCIINGLKWR
jgi:hypothetical protein